MEISACNPRPYGRGYTLTPLAEALEKNIEKIQTKRSIKYSPIIMAESDKKS